jgi:hypothetical protein
VNLTILNNATKHKISNIPLSEALLKDKNSSYFHLANAIKDPNIDISFFDYILFFNSVEYGNSFFITQAFKSGIIINELILHNLFMKACFYEHTNIITIFLNNGIMKTFNKKNLKNVHSKKSIDFINSYINISNF